MRQLKRHKNTPMGLEVICFSGKACLKGFKFLVITQPIKIFRKTLYFTQSFHHTLEFIILRSVRSSYSDNTSQRMQTHFQNIHRTEQNRKMTGETPEVRSDKRKPREDRQNQQISQISQISWTSQIDRERERKRERTERK